VSTLQQILSLRATIIKIEVYLITNSYEMIVVFRRSCSVTSKDNVEDHSGEIKYLYSIITLNDKGYETINKSIKYKLEIPQNLLTV
jgi:hypothetical protein